MFNIQETLNEFGLSNDEYEKLLDKCQDKVHKRCDDDWIDISNDFQLGYSSDTLRKAQQLPLLGGAFVKQYYDEKYANKDSYYDNVEYLNKLDEKEKKIRKERMKLQALNLERNRLDRNEARQELYYEYIHDAITTLPLPKFERVEPVHNKVEYLLNIADIHYGAVFESINNKYSPEIARERFEYLAAYVKDFVKSHNVSTLRVLVLGDDIQGILRINDLRINDSSIVKATIEVSNLIATFLNDISQYVDVEYYHTPRANHTQIRPLGSKASELADEDLEYIIGHYIKMALSNNNHVNVNLSDDCSNYIEIYIPNFNVIACHGNTIKNQKDALKQLNFLMDKDYDYLIMGHFHGGNTFSVGEGLANDKEVIIAGSFVGSDPYSDTLFAGAKASCQILGFDRRLGHTETYKIILN